MTRRRRGEKAIEVISRITAETISLETIITFVKQPAAKKQILQDKGNPTETSQ